MTDEIPILIKRLRGGRQPLPAPATAFSAGVDLYADIEKSLTLQPGETAAVPTGIAIALPEGWEAQVRPRSGLSLKHNILLPNSPGTIDSDFRGEIKVVMTNWGRASFTVEPGQRIAQLMVAKVVHPRWIEVDELPPTERGEGGFGHTGR